MSRGDRWEVELLDRHDRLKPVRLRARDGKLDWSIFRSVPGSGSITVTLGAEDGIDWLHDRIRITHVDDRAGVRTRFGVWLLSIPGREVDGPAARTTIALSDKTELLNSPIGDWVTIPAGTNVIDAIVGIIHARGERMISVTESPAMLGNAQSWNPAEDGATWLRVVNDLLAMINYSSLWADMSGYLRLDPYVAPAQRPITAIYGDRAETDLRMLPAWSDEAALFDLPSGVRVFVDGDETTPGFAGRADLPDDHPLSAASRGREVLRVEQQEATSQAVATAIAQRLLAESHQVLRSISVTHPVDDTQLNDVVLHRPTDVSAAIVERSVTLGLGAVVTDRIRHIYTGGELPWPLG